MSGWVARSDWLDKRYGKTRTEDQRDGMSTSLHSGINESPCAQHEARLCKVSREGGSFNTRAGVNEKEEVFVGEGKEQAVLD
jgi:hypothetical protein